MSKYQQELLKLQKQNGGILNPKIVIDSARDKKSPLHDYFVWDNAKASEKYRLIQAEELIRRVRVEIITPEQKTVLVRQFISLPRDRKPVDSKEGGYRLINQVMTTQDMRYEYLTSIQDEINALTYKLKTVSDAAFDLGVKLKREIQNEVEKAKPTAEAI